MKISKTKGKKFERQKIMPCKVAKLLPCEKLMACVKCIVGLEMCRKIFAMT